ncbi:MAG: AMP-binding protein, partial [Syntrophales bacterium]|nr:AMP-binding protein [Syntrophales bacterium]
MKLIDKTIGRVFEEQVALHSDEDFLIYADRGLRFTFRAYNDRVNRLAKGFLAIGIRKGDHVGLWATNVPDWLTVFFATAKIGAVLVTVNTAYRLHELEYLIEQSDITTLCLIDGYRDSNYVSMVNELIPELKTAQRGKLSSARYPCLKNLVFIGPEKHRGMFNTQELLLLGSQVEDAELDRIKNSLNCQEVVNMQYTSGTTGFPKGVMLTHHNILNNGFTIGENLKLTHADRLCLCVPLFHCFGLVLCMMSVITHGASVVAVEQFDPLLVLASVQQEKCTVLCGVPTMFIAELNHPMFKLFDMTSLRTGIMAGSPCPTEVMRRVIEEMNMREITIVYGLTETSPGMTQSRTDDPLEDRVNTVGRAFPGVEVKVINPETGEECPVGVNGEMCCRGYNIMKGYYKMPEATFQVIDKNGYLHSGDLGFKDEKGNFHITGRIKDMIIRGGENIYPCEVEEYLRGIEAIKDVQVVGIPSAKYGEEVAAFIILKDGALLTEEEVLDFCRGRISRYKIPTHLFFVDDFPM